MPNLTNYIKYNGLDTRDFDIAIEHSPDYDFAEMDVEFVHVPGRSGDLLLNNNCYKNTTRTYELARGAYNSGRFAEYAASISRWLHSANTYARLEDSFEPDVYRMALFKSSGTITNVLDSAGRISVSFDCKPQRYLKTGDIPTTYNSSSTGYSTDGDINSWQIPANTTGFVSKPIIKLNFHTVQQIPEHNVYNFKILNCYGQLPSDYFDISTRYTSIVFDSEAQEVYGVRFVDNVETHDDLLPSLSFNEFPVISEASTIIVTAYVTDVEITPRWYRI